METMDTMEQFIERNQGWYIKAHTKYTPKVIRQFAISQIPHWKFGIIFTMLLFLGSVHRVIYSWSNDEPVSGILYLWIALGFITIVCLIAMHIEPKKCKKELTECTVLFIEDMFAVSRRGVGCNFDGEIRYDDLAKICETPTMFYIYADKRNIYLVDKNALEGGTAEDLREFLMQKVPKEKYRAVRMNKKAK